MLKVIRHQYVLEGLNCANCAGKIENGVKEIPGISHANMNFVSKTLTVEFSATEDLDNVLTKIQSITDDIEKGVTVRNKADHNHDHHLGHHTGKGELTKIILGGSLFAIAIAFNLPKITEFIMFFLAYILVGGEVLLKAYRNILRGQIFDENFLMSLATIGAFAIGEFPEGVAVMLFYKVGEYVQGIAINRSRQSIAALMDIRPDYANLKTIEGVKKVSPEVIRVGDIIVIKPGERVPLDGKVLDGFSSLDTSALTGESIPRDVETGSDILSGSVNHGGVLTVEVTKEFGESTVSKILDLVQNASGKKAPTENFITKFARYYTPVVVGIAATLAIIPPLVIPEATFSPWIYRALIFLVISCPCALVISIPLGFFGGIGGASKKGILVKGSNYLEALNDVEMVVFDKTGTLTKGVFTVTGVFPKDDTKEDELLEYAAYAERYSNHPIAKSILKHHGKDILEAHLSQYQELPGQGVKVKVKDNVVLAGNSKLMLNENIDYIEENFKGTLVHVAINGKYLGYIEISDQIKEDSKEAIEGLKSLGIKKTVMLTGDNPFIAEEVKNQVGVDEFIAQLLPHEKVAKLEDLEKLKSPKGKLIFVGDGINDAPVLARADVGMAMGGLGSDAAIEAADIVIMNDEPSKLVTAIKIAKRTRRIVWQNIIFAIGVKLLVLALGAGGLASIWEAVFADVGVTVLAVFNAMRVMNVKDV